MPSRADETAALLALLKLKQRGESWGAIASEVAFEGSASALFEARTSDALLPSLEALTVLDDARATVESWGASGLQYCTVLDDEYPVRLRDIHEMPPFL